MSKDWADDINMMHSAYGVHEWMATNPDKILQYLDFCVNFIREELEETAVAVRESNAEEVVDGLIDICVVAISTLDAFGVDAHKAWDEVLRANMHKQVGVNKSRPNPLGLPDLIKPTGWKAPSHNLNYGLLFQTGE